MSVSGMSVVRAIVDAGLEGEGQGVRSDKPKSMLSLVNQR